MNVSSKGHEISVAVNCVSSYSDRGLSDQNFLVYGGDDTIAVISYSLQGGPKIKEHILQSTTSGSNVIQCAFSPRNNEREPIVIGYVNNRQQVAFVEKSPDPNIEIKRTILDKPVVGHFAPIHSFAIMRSSNDILGVTCSEDRSLKIFSYRNRSRISEISHANSLLSCTIPPKNSNYENLISVSDSMGIIHFHDQRSSRRSFQTRTTMGQDGRPIRPLNQIDWNTLNSHYVGGVAGAQYFHWDLRNPKSPCGSGASHFDGACWFKWSTLDSGVFATGGLRDLKIWRVGGGQGGQEDHPSFREDRLIQVYQQKRYKLGGLCFVCGKVRREGEIEWQGETNMKTVSYVATGGDKRINFYEC